MPGRAVEPDSQFYYLESGAYKSVCLFIGVKKVVTTAAQVCHYLKKVVALFIGSLLLMPFFIASGSSVSNGKLSIRLQESVQEFCTVNFSTGIFCTDLYTDLCTDLSAPIAMKIVCSNSFVPLWNLSEVAGKKLQKFWAKNFNRELASSQPLSASLWKKPFKFPSQLLEHRNLENRKKFFNLSRSIMNYREHALNSFGG